MTTTMQEPVTLKLSRFIKAPRERVFAAWTNAHELAQWLGGGPREVTSAKIDLRVGGKYSLISSGDCGANGEKHETHFTGVYREIKAPARLVFTWTGTCVPGLQGVETVVTVELTEQKDGTLFELTHEGFPTAEICDKHNFGWSASFDTLEKLV